MLVNARTGKNAIPELEDICGWLPDDYSLEIWREGDDHYAAVLDGSENDPMIGHGGIFEEAAENAYLAWRMQ